MKEWISGRNPVFEVLRAGRRHVFRLQIAQGIEEKGRIKDIISLCKKHKLPAERVARQSLDKLGGNHQGVALEASGYPYAALPDILQLSRSRQEALFVLLLDTLQDPQNLGSLLRTAEAVGIHGVFLPARRSASVTPAVVHASAGASEHLLIAQMNLAQAVDEVKKAGAWVIGLDSGDGVEPIRPQSLSGALALVVGSEGEGMRSLVRRSCDLLFRLPMQGKIASLNAAVAGSVVLYMAFQNRRETA